VWAAVQSRTELGALFTKLMEETLVFASLALLPAKVRTNMWRILAQESRGRQMRASAHLAQFVPGPMSTAQAATISPWAFA